MENAEELKLLGFWVSPMVLRVEWALMLKGITDYEYIDEDVLHNKSSLLLELNPIHKKVPVLIHKGKALIESLVIVEYIDETWKNCPLLPQDPYEKARIKSFAMFAEKLIYDSYTASWSQGEAKEKLVKSTIEAFEKIEEEIRGKTYFGGESLGFLDIALGWISLWLPAWEEVGSMTILDPIKFPGIASWVQTFASQPVIKEKLPSKERVVKFYHERRIYKREELTGALLKLKKELYEAEERVKILTAEWDGCKEAKSELKKLELEKEEGRVAFKAINDQYNAAKEECERLHNQLQQLARK